MTAVTLERWERLKGLLYDGMRHAPDARARFLDEACSSEVTLRAEVESLLLAEEDVRSRFLESVPQADALLRDLERIESACALAPGQVFAERYQLVRKLGEGGMGQVWLAEQTAPIQRQVALKLIRAGLYDAGLVERLKWERQSLAIMDHPAIARVFDAGATPEGQPYFVMEYVAGLPITEYCDRKQLRIAERLELFTQACGGVQHAHQKAIIHRDLKPANILVVEVDGKPSPRIIDFGLAKAPTPAITGARSLTQVRDFVGTPGYMSPEQANPDVQDLDARTDVYSLGVVLYVLLAGLQPFETAEGQKQPLDELLHRLREEEPQIPSARVAMNRITSAAIAGARRTEPRQLVGLLRGDLDQITMKALETDRDRRYSSPSELAADVRRFLNHEPVMARLPGAGYRLRKYTRRHRAAVGIAVALVLLLAAFTVLQAVELRRITRERDRANRERDRATRITDFMTGMFKVPDPNEARGNSVTAREILDKASNEIGNGLANDPEVRSQMMQIMAGTYANLGLYARAQELAKRALDARLSLHGPDERTTLESMAQLGFVLDKEGNDAEAEKLERRALAGQRRILGPEDPHTLDTMDTLAIILQRRGHYAEEEKLGREALKAGVRKTGPESPQTLRAMEDLGSALWYQGRYAAAEDEFRQLLELSRRVVGRDHPRTVLTMSNLALAIKSQGRFAEAEPLYREVLSVDQRVLGPAHPALAHDMDGLANDLYAEGHLADAEKLYRDAMGIRLRTLGPEHRETLESRSNLASLLFRRGQLREAEKQERETLGIQSRVLGPGDLDTLASKGNLAGILNRVGRYAEAEKNAQETFKVEIRALGPLHLYTLDSLQQLGMATAHRHRYSEATGLFWDVIEQARSFRGQGNRWSVWYAFACVAAAANHPDDSLRYLHEAVNRGYKDADGLTADDDLKNLRDNPRFRNLITILSRRSPAPMMSRYSDYP